MVVKCAICGDVSARERLIFGKVCVECFAEDWGALVVESPMASPNILFSE